MKHDKQSFMEQLFEGSKYKVINGTALSAEGKSTIKLTLHEGCDNGTPVRCHYDGLLLEIIVPGVGVITSATFRFSDVMVHAENPHCNSDPKRDLHVNSSCGWDWYIDYPTRRSTTRFINNINDYASYFI